MGQTRSDYSFDFFLAAAEGDEPAARDLHRRLEAGGVRVFSEPVSLRPGDEKDVAVPAAQRASRVSVILLSDRADDAYFRQEAVANAIALARRDEGYRVVPAYLTGHRLPANTDYGLRRLVPVFFELKGGARGVVEELVRLHERLVADEEAVTTPPPEEGRVLAEPPGLGPFPVLPYPVLRAYEDPRLLGGRDRDLRELLDKLGESPPILGVFGASGAGKTSLLQAGLLPALRGSGVPVALSRHPAEGGLAGRLLGQVLAEVPAEAEDRPGFAAALARARRAAGQPPVLVLDQFEDVFKDEARRGCAVVGPLIAATVGWRGAAQGALCRWVLAYRHEFHGEVQAWLGDVLADARRLGDDGLAPLPDDVSGPDRFHSWRVPPLGTARPGEEPEEVARAAFRQAIERPLAAEEAGRPRWPWTVAADDADRLAAAFSGARVRRPDAPLVPELQVVLARLLDETRPDADGTRPLAVPGDVERLVDGALREHLVRALERAFPAMRDDQARRGRTYAMLALRRLADAEGRRAPGLSEETLAPVIGPDGPAVLERLADPGVRLIVPRPSPGGLRYELSHDRLARVLADLTDEQVLGRGETFDRELLDLAAFIGRRSELFSHAGDAAAVQLDRGQTRAVRERGAELLWGEERRAWWAACQAAAAERTRRRRRWTALGMVALLLLALAVWQGFVRQSRAALERQLVESGDADTILAATAGLLDGHGLDADDLASVLDRRQEPPPPEALFGETTLAAGREAARLAIARAGAGRARLAEDFGAVIGSLDELRRSGDPEIASEAGARRREVLAALSQRFSAPPKEEDIEWVDVPGGTFTMGCVEERDAPCDGDERPPHEVTLSPFRMLAHEVTIGQMAAFEDASFYRGEDRQTAAFAVNWYEAVAYAAWVGGRLPTEAEWEYACRAGSPARYAGGPKEADVAKMAWYAANSGGKAHAVKTREPNAWGLHDLHGNLWEWASDRYGGYAETAANDPAGPAVGALRVLRGGSWDYPARNLRASLRNWLVPGNRNWYIGFRVVRPAPEP